MAQAEAIIAQKGYANPNVLVTTEWVALNRKVDDVRLIEVDVDTTLYEQGHIEGAAGLNWTTQLCDQVRRDILTKTGFQELVERLGITKDTTIVFYGDNNNWFATYALWQFRYWGHDENKLKIIDGGRVKWLGENRPVTKDIPNFSKSTYPVGNPDESVRANKDEILETLNKKVINLVDVRSNPEFTGEVIAPPGMSETAQRGGHIPGAANIPWAQAVNQDGTFKSFEELDVLYRSKGIDPIRNTIAYCRIGERSSHSWFVLKYLLGHRSVKNYDGSWTEWGNLVGAPIEKP
jgi:thiosulfate/3-mercaptopyruvate sulfurtransferase